MQSIAVIDSTADEVDQINDKIAAFKDNTDKITKIIDQIKDLADNSSLLALNASIEAARAGEKRLLFFLSRYMIPMENSSMLLMN